tara:strand:- start:11772 stop:13970 length:2199 start_codon:yes stop_codon:yes gene_type:complete
MGTYTQPSQILDTSFGDFQKAATASYDKEQAKIAARQKNMQAMAAKVLKERQKKLLAAQNAQLKKEGVIAEEIANTQAAVQGYTDNRQHMGLKITRNDGGTQVTQLNADNWNSYSKLIENYSLYSTPINTTSGKGERQLGSGFEDDGSGNFTYTGDDLSTPGVTELGYQVKFSKDELDWLEHAMVTENRQVNLNNKLLGGTPKIENDQETDMHITDWYNSYKGKFQNEGDLSLGIDGSMNAQIELAGAMMGKYDKNSPQYQQNRLILESTQKEMPEFIGMLNNLSDLQKKITKTDGSLKETNQVNSIRYDLGGTPEEQDMFELQTNFALDWGQPNTAHRFHTLLSPTGPKIVYYNPHISDKEFIVTKEDVANWAENNGNMGVYTLDQEALDVVEENLEKSIRTTKPVYTRSNNKYQITRQDGTVTEVSESEAALDFSTQNDLTYEDIQSFFYDKDRIVGNGFGNGSVDAGDFDGQNTWQLIGGPKAGGGQYGLNWIDISKCTSAECKEKARAQQDYMVEHYMNKYRKDNYSTLDTKTIKTLKKDGSKQKADSFISGESKITFNDTSLSGYGFKRDSDGESEYTIEEIASKYDQLRVTNNNGVNGIAELLNNIGNYATSGKGKSALQYMSGAQLRKMYSDNGYQVDATDYPDEENGRLNLYFIGGSGAPESISIGSQAEFIKRVATSSGISGEVATQIQSDFRATTQVTTDIVMNRSNEEIYDFLSSNLPTLG